MAKATGRPPRSAADIQAFRSTVAKRALALYREEGFGAVSMRRLARDVGCTPTTIYAHFEGKTDILRHLWAALLDEAAAKVRDALIPVADPVERLQVAVRVFVSYWTDHPGHFRLVFMSGDVERSDVTTFMRDDQTLAHFRMFADLVGAAATDDGAVKSRTDALVAAMLGMALCANTIRDYPWAPSSAMTDHLLVGIIG